MRSFIISTLAFMVLVSCVKKTTKIEFAPDGQIQTEKPLVILNNSPESGGGQEMNERRETVYFEFDSDELRASETGKLDFNYKKVYDIRITGYCCPIGTKEYNYFLGERRAEMVKQYLIDNGICPKDIMTVSNGELNPVSLEPDEYWKNRRAEISISFNQ